MHSNRIAWRVLAVLLVPVAAAIADIPKHKPVLLTKLPNGDPALGYSYSPTISKNARIVAFESDAAWLVNQSFNGNLQILVLDRDTGKFELASRTAAGAPVNDDCFDPHLTANGRYVVFGSRATDIVSGDASNDTDIYRFDRVTKIVTMVSKNDLGASANMDCVYPFVSPNGRYVSFSTASNNLGPLGNGQRQIFVRDLNLATTFPISTNALGQLANGRCYTSASTDDGKLFVFQSDASNLDDPQAVNGQTNVWLHDMQAGTNVLISKPHDSAAQVDGYVIGMTISHEGRYVVFSSTSTHLVPNDPDGNGEDLFLFDRKNSTMKMLTPDVPGLFDDGFGYLTISKDSKLICFRGVETVGHGGDDAIAIYDRIHDTTKLVSRKPDGTNADGAVNGGTQMTPDGKYVVFESASAEIGADQDFHPDIFIFRR